jgi:hypothetical protein
MAVVAGVVRGIGVALAAGLGVGVRGAFSTGKGVGVGVVFSSFLMAKAESSLIASAVMARAIRSSDFMATCLPGSPTGREANLTGLALHVKKVGIKK